MTYLLDSYPLSKYSRTQNSISKDPLSIAIYKVETNIGNWDKTYWLPFYKEKYLVSGFG